MMNEDQREYLKLEYKTATDEIKANLAEIRTRERFALTSLAAAGAWIVVQLVSEEHPKEFFGYGNPIVIKALLVLTDAILALLAISIFLLNRNVKRLGDYIQAIEIEFLGDNAGNMAHEFGWETHLKRNFVGHDFAVHSYISWTIYLGLPLILIALVH